MQGDGQHNIIKFGTTTTGRQRYQCQTCQGTLTETKGTIFYRRRTSEAAISETLALIAEGDRISSLARVKGHKPDTIIGWVREAGAYAEAIEAVVARLKQKGIAIFSEIQNYENIYKLCYVRGPDGITLEFAE